MISDVTKSLTRCDNLPGEEEANCRSCCFVNTLSFDLFRDANKLKKNYM